MSPKPYDQSSRNIEYELVLANYATKYYLKDEAGVDKSNLAAKFASLQRK